MAQNIMQQVGRVWGRDPASREMPTDLEGVAPALAERRVVSTIRDRPNHSSAIALPLPRARVRKWRPHVSSRLDAAESVSSPVPAYRSRRFGPAHFPPAPIRFA